MDTIETLEYLVEGPKMSAVDRFVRIRRPKPQRRSSRQASKSQSPGGIRLRRNRRWSW